MYDFEKFASVIFAESDLRAYLPPPNPKELTHFRSIQVTLYILVFQAVAFVVGFLAAGQGYLHFRYALFVDKQSKGHYGGAAFLQFAAYFLQLRFVEQQLAVALLFVVVYVSVAVGGYQHVFHPQFAVLQYAETVGEVGLSVAYGFYFGAQ